jgi:predicted esterase
MSDETPEIPKLTGPTLEPLGGRTPKQLVIMCHGVGSDGDDLLGFSSTVDRSAISGSACRISQTRNAPGACAVRHRS